MKYINLPNGYNWQPDGMFLRILPEQPPPDYDFTEVAEVLSQGYISEAYSLELKKIFKLPFTVGEIVGFKHKGKVIGTVDVKRVREITNTQLQNTYFDTYHNGDPMYVEPKIRLQNWFNSCYAKPRPVKKAGKVVSYVAYVYEKNKESMQKFDKYLMGDYWYYKGLPLKIIANPVVVLYGHKEVQL